MKFIILCFLLACSVWAEEKVDSKAFITANLNDYVDNIMPSITNFLITNGMDPMEIPDITQSFSVKPFLIEYHGKLELTEGSLFNIRSLRRSGDITVSYQNKLVKVKGDFGLADLNFNFEYLAKIMDIGPTGGVKGSVSKISVLAEFLVDFNSNEVHLQDFYLHDLGTIDVKLTGNIIADFLSNAVIKVITTLFKDTIMNVVESNLRMELEKYLENINTSVGGVNKLLAEMRMANNF